MPGQAALSFGSSSHSGAGAQERTTSVRRGLHLADRLLRFGQQLAGCRHRLPAGVVQLNAVFAAGEQRHAEVFLHIFHAAGDGRGGDVTLFRHFGKGAQVRKIHQLLQLIQIQHCTPHISFCEKQFPLLIFYVFADLL